MTKEISQIISSISEIVKIDSYQKAPAEGAPFGESCAKALDYFLSLAKSFGFETKNYDNYAGEIIFGEGEEFAILAHLDVVPAGNGWTHEPFGGEIDCKNGRIWGRGTMDDKGPAVITLYAMKALKDSGFAPKKKIKLIVGCNEETGWKCIEYYNSHAHMPDSGFSPDAEFPVIYAEKGILHVRFKFGAKGDYSTLKGGKAANMVCDYCEVSAPVNDDKLEELNLSVENGKIVSRGKSAHGSTPEMGVNAIPAVLRYLGLNDICDTLFESCFNLKELHDETGYLTFSPNVIEGGKNCVFVTCDIRYPATMPQTTVTAAFEKAGVSYEILHFQAPLYNDKDCFLIKTLCEVYGEVTGKKVEPIAIGGGTYARALKCGAGFGPEEAGEENTIHQANEYITFEKIEKSYKVYKLAIQRLTK